MFKYPCLCVCMCVYIIISSEIFLLHTEKVFFSRNNHLCVFFSGRRLVCSFITSITSEKPVHLQYLFSYWFHNADTFTLFPLLVKDNACKSNSDLRVNLKEFIKEIYSKKNWIALLIQRQLMALVNPAIAAGAILKWCWGTELSMELA